LYLANLVGLGERLDHRPTQLSGGQQQRVAIARSLINDPYFILADEPTGNLDSRTTEEILQLFERLNNEGRTIILVTHEDEVSKRAKRVIRLKDGMLQWDRTNTQEVRDEAARYALENMPVEV
ncbi:MAG: ABC transporter ATP-binding protein, partial [Planctomycetota bacterium]